MYTMSYILKRDTGEVIPHQWLAVFIFPLLVIFSGAVNAQQSQTTLIPRIKIATGRVTSSSTHTDSALEAWIRNEIQRNLEKLENRYDYEVSDSIVSNLLVNARYKIYQGKSEFAYELLIELVMASDKRDVVGAFTVMGKHHFMGIELSMKEPIFKILDFLLGTRVSTHTQALTSRVRESSLLKPKYSIVLETDFDNKICNSRKKSLYQLLENMFIDVAGKVLISKSFLLVDGVDIKPESLSRAQRQNQINCKASFSKVADSDQHLLVIRYHNNEGMLLESRNINFSLKDGDYAHFIIKVYPKINYFRTRHLD